MEQELRQILEDVCGVTPGFDRTAHFYSTLGVPSMKAMMLLMALEERFEIHVPDERFLEAVDLEKLIAMIEDLRTAGA